jgi:microcin C transport system permease protein
MSTPATDIAEAAGLVRAAAPTQTSLSPNRRAWARFRQHRLGYVSLIVFGVLMLLAVFADVLCNERPLVARYNGEWFFPIVSNPPETRFGGDFLTPTEWHDPFIQDQFRKDGNFVVFPLNPYGARTVNYFKKEPAPAPPDRENLLGTDEGGRDMLARLVYGFRVSVAFGFVLTAVAVVIGIVMGAIQGYFGGKVDLITQRIIEIWNSVPELFLLIILASIFEPSVPLLIAVLSLHGWVGLSDYVRAEFLRNRGLEFVKAARAMGLTNRQIITRHLLPNSITPVITFLPFRMSVAILSLAALDFLGLGVTDLPSLGDLLRQGKENLDAWWISVPTFLVLVMTLLLLTFIGDALRDAFDTRKAVTS